MQGRRKLKTRQQFNQDVYKLDASKSPEENVLDILQALYLREIQQPDVSPLHSQLSSFVGRSLKSLSESRRLSYLNALVTLMSKDDTKQNLGFSTEELMLCIRVSLVDESADMRATALRVLRYLLQTESDVDIFNSLRLPYLVVRSLDLLPRNEGERAQALRVIRRVVAVAGIRTSNSQKEKVDLGLMRCLVAIARSTSGSGDQGSGDRLARPCIATLAEIGVINPSLFIACDGVGAVTRFLLECTTPQMAEALCGVLLHTLDRPEIRTLARVDLKCLAAPYNEFHSKHVNDKVREEREKRFTSSRLSLVCVLRSWPGTLHFCNPQTQCGLRSLVHALYLNHRDVRRAILDLLYELLGLPQPEWTDEISVALAAVDPSDFQESWRLNEGFVAAEGRSILPHLAATGLDIIEMHLALLLYCFLEAGLLDGLAEVIVSSDTFISVRATVLLGQLLHLSSSLVPSVRTQAGALAAHAARAHPHALRATAALHALHRMHASRPASCSLFLDHVLHCAAGVYSDSKARVKEPSEPDSSSQTPPHRHSFSDKESAPQFFLVKSNSLSSRTSAVVKKVAQSTKLFNIFDREKDNLLRDSLVMQQKEGSSWDWGVIRAILREDKEKGSLLNLNDSSDRAWVRKVVSYLAPSRNKYSHGDLSAPHHATQAACQLLRLLLKDPEGIKILEELFLDVNSQVRAILAARHAHDCLFSPQHMTNTNCQMYFLFIGQLCHTRAGLKLFYDTGLYQSLLELLPTKHCCYVKLIVTSLNYTLDSHPRDILERTLMDGTEESRLYATQFLNVLLRASQKSSDLIKRRYRPKKISCERKPLNGDCENNGFGKDMETWILELLIKQIKDKSKAVSKTALEILDEACHVPTYLDRLVKLRDTVSEACGIDKNNSTNIRKYDDRSYLLWLHLHLEAAVRHGNDDDFIMRQLEYWMNSYNYRYVGVLEAEWARALNNGGLGNASGGSEPRAMPPPHALLTLARHPRSHILLVPTLQKLIMCLKQGRTANEQEIMDMKSSLWSLGNVAKTAEGVEMLQQMATQQDENAFTLIVQIARHCPVYSLRAAAFYSLGLVATNYKGANVLQDLGWITIRHTRHDRFPVLQEDPLVKRSSSKEDLLTPTPTRDQRATAHRIDVEISEHSDHSVGESVSEPRQTLVRSDNSTTESVNSEQRVNISVDDSDVTDGRTNVNTTPPKLTEGQKKSQTLPPRTYLQHDRSLSESKTVDILRDHVIYEDTIHVGPIPETRLTACESRVRNTSESSTSGVSSSYESGYGRHPFSSEKILPLSPIPSSSSVTGMRGAVPRRTSLISISGVSGSTPASASDLHGIATLRALNSHRRPHLSESAASEEAWRTRSSRRSLPKHRHALSLLKYDWRPLEPADCTEWEWLSSSNPSGRSPLTSRVPHIPAPSPTPPTRIYRGIALPARLADIFPQPEWETVAPAQPQAETVLSESSNSFKGVGVACGGGSCLACVRAPGPSTAQLREAFFSGMESERTGPHWFGSYSRSWSASLSRSHTPRSEHSGIASVPLPHAILKHAAHLANPLNTKVTKTYLISLKQRHPEAFQSVCLYSEVSKALSESPYLMSSRRFLQELFLDLSFECFTVEAQQIITAKRCNAKTAS